MNVVFFNADGVLNSIKPFCNSFSYDEIKVSTFASFLQQNGATAVLTSPWRKGWSLHRHECSSRIIFLMDNLAKYGIPRTQLRVTDPDIDYREEAIVKYLREYRPERYIIFDTEPYHYIMLRPYLLDPDLGFTKYEFEHAELQRNLVP